MDPRDTITRQPVADDKLRRAKELRRDQTPAERLLWERLRRSQLDGLHFRRQQVILGFIADFYCHAAALVVELDGGIHEHQREADAERDAILKGAGFRVLRFSNEAVLAQPDDVLRRIAAACGVAP